MKLQRKPRVLKVEGKGRKGMLEHCSIFIVFKK